MGLMMGMGLMMRGAVNPYALKDSEKGLSFEKYKYMLKEKPRYFGYN